MKKYLAIAVLSFIFLAPGTARAAITLVTLTPASPTTMTNGRSYYLAGVPYEFRVQASDPAATGKAYWDRIVVDIRQGAVTQESFTINIGPDNAPSVTGVIVDSIVDQSGATYTNIDYRITVRFLWTCTYFTAGTNSVLATVYTDPPVSSMSNQRSFYFGVISAIRVLNFAQSGEASDGKITPWHADFNVTGRIVYYDAAAPAQIIANQVPLPEITAVSLFRAKTAPVPAGPVDTTLSPAGTNNDFIFTIDQSFLGPAGRPGNLGVYRWDIRATMATGGVTEISGNTLDVRMDEVRIDSLVFEAGGGVNPAAAPADYYVRSVNVTGTRIRLRASMRSGVGPAGMAGNTSITITTGANTYTLLIPNLAVERTVLIDPVPAVAPGANVEVNYTVSAISGSSYDGGQSLPARIVDATGTDSRAYPCRWENHHPPGNNAPPFTGAGAFSSTATSFTVAWTPLSDAGPRYDHDFYTYRIYFKRSADADWTMLDRTVAGFASLGTIGTGVCTVGSAANPLQVLTSYDYQVSAEDVWGNEVILANRIQNSLSTTAFQVTASISDGISVYNNEHFNNPDPSTRKMRDAGIKITLRITTSGGAPEKVSIIFAANDSDMVAQHGVTGAFDSLLDLGFPADQLWTVPCLKVTANTYEGFISSEHPLMQYGTNIRFIVATEKSGNPTYTDHTPDPPGPGDVQSDEWRFRVEKTAIFIPWPTRVLNNVMTSQMPCCYPAYFIPVDSLVTIKVYDVKGRVIATLGDRVYRPGGQNIKDSGWCGFNKDNRRVGPGLYYIEIKAVTIGNKTVINKMLKVVVAH